MNNKTYISFAILLFICIALNLFLLIKYNVACNSYLHARKELLEAKLWNSKLDAIYNNKDIEIVTEYCSIPDYLIFWDESGEYYDISDVLSENNKMVFYFSENHCSDCIKSALNEIINIPDSTTLNNYIILCNYLNARHFQTLLKEYDLRVPIYNINGQRLNIPAEEMNSPFFFIINSDLRCRQVFIPIKEIENYTANYLEKMNKKYWSSSNK